MVEFEIEWSYEAEIDLFEIMIFYFERNGNKIFSEKIYNKINFGTEIISKHPQIGRKSKSDNTRKFIMGDFEINYEIIHNTILISMIWDSAMNPENKRVGK
ncbi:MAG: type II toxin-antitoxin system RelE/ParE family toxin [Bacteroidota bacterium]